jgi:hypothetical protein
MLAHSWFAGDQPRDGEEDDGNRQAGRRSQVARAPVRIELRLVLVEALEIVELLAQVEDGGTDLVPERRERVALQAGERRDAEIEPAIALVATPQHELREQQVHHAARRSRVVAHQVDRHFVSALDLP